MYVLQNVFFVKKYFTFGIRHVLPETSHIYQTSDAPLLIYKLHDRKDAKL